jgi:hypothetical protein
LSPELVGLLGVPLLVRRLLLLDFFLAVILVVLVVLLLLPPEWYATFAIFAALDFIFVGLPVLSEKFQETRSK